MSDYTIKWTMDLDGANVADVALQALGIQRDADSIATVVTVTDLATDAEFEIDSALVEQFALFTKLDIEDTVFFDAYQAWMGGGVLTPSMDLADWWAENQGKWC